MSERRYYTRSLRACLSALICSLSLLACSSFFASTKWEKLSEGTHPHIVPFLSLFFFDSYNGVAATSTSLERTADGGKTWTPLIADDLEQSFQALAFTTPTTGFVVGLQKKNNDYAPMILRTEDGGRNWQESLVNVRPRTTGIKPLLQSVSFCNQEIGWAAGSDLILHTGDGGQTWETQQLRSDGGLFGIVCLTPKQAVAVGQEGLILLTQDGGKTWSRQTSGTADHLLRVRFFGNEAWILGGMAGKSALLRSHDGGVTWQPLSIQAGQTLFDIYINESQGWIVGAKGTILHSNDAGQTWKLQESPTVNDLAYLFFLSPHEGWAAGDKRTLLHYRDAESAKPLTP